MQKAEAKGYSYACTQDDQQRIVSLTDCTSRVELLGKEQKAETKGYKTTEENSEE